MGMTRSVKVHIGPLQFRDYPGPVAVAPRFRAGLDDACEGMIESGRNSLFAQCPFQAARDPETVRKEHGARVGGPPENRLALAVPGKDAAPVGVEQPGDRKVSANGQ